MRKWYGDIIEVAGIVCFVIVLSLVTGMVKEPWWFRFIYNFPLILLIVHLRKEHKEKGEPQ